MVVTISRKLKEEISGSLKQYGYKSTRDFIEDALKHRISMLKKKAFFLDITKVRRAMKKSGLTESDILGDFERSRNFDA